MFPEINSQVKLMFNNGVSVEGKVLQWSNDISVLISDDGGKFLINKTKDNVMVVKIQPKEKFVEEPVTEIEIPGSDTKLVYPVTVELNSSIKDPPPPKLAIVESNKNLRHLKLAELRSVQIKAKQQELRDKMKTFTITTPTEVKYASAFQTIKK